MAIFLATGQDAANLVEGSQGITYTDLVGEDLYFSVNLPNIIIGSVGGGAGCKKDSIIKNNLTTICGEDMDVFRFAEVVAGAVWCGELSLMAALTNNGELVRSHTLIER